jgi:hypothetical protein
MFRYSLESHAGLVSLSLDLSGVQYLIRFWENGAFQLILLGLAIIGSLKFLYFNNRSGAKLGLMTSAGALFVTLYIFQLFNLKNIVPERWYPFIYVLVSILAMFGLLSLSSIMKNQVAKLTTIMLPILLMIFLMTTNTAGNSDSPLVYNGAQRMGHTQSELVSVQTLSEMGSGCPIVDLRWGNTVPYIIGGDNYKEMVARDNKIFILRNYYLNHPEWNNRYRDKITEGNIYQERLRYVVFSDYAKQLAVADSPLIYSNGNVAAYLLGEQVQQH